MAEFERDATHIQNYVKAEATESGSLGLMIVGDYIASVMASRGEPGGSSPTGGELRLLQLQPRRLPVVCPQPRERRQLRGLQLGWVRRCWCVPVHARYLELDRSVVGTSDLVGVDPAQAAPADQDAMAQALYAQQGSAPWGGAC